jgi:NTP pyrophosphatase (non-canonical NTP hydrolase)
MKDINEYQKWALSLWKDADSIQLQIVHALLGLTTEVGEVADLFKKPWFTPMRADGFNVEELTKELGDVLYYLVMLAEMHGVDMSDVLRKNHDKLEARYGKQS